MIFTATKQSRIFGGHSGIIPNSKTGMIPNSGFLAGILPNEGAGVLPKSRFAFLGEYSPTNSYDFVKERENLVHTSNSIALMIAPFMTDAARYNATPSALNDMIARLRIAIQELEAQYKRFDSYYGQRVNDTSGGKRTRLRNERTDLQMDNVAARQKANAAITMLTDSLNSKASLALTQTGNDPNKLIVTQNRDTGEYVYQRPAVPAPASSNQASTGMPSWLLPVGAAVAAYLAFK